MKTKVRQATVSGDSPPLRMLYIKLSPGRVLGGWLLNGARQIRLDETIGSASKLPGLLPQKPALSNLRCVLGNIGVHGFNEHKEDVLHPSASAPSMFLYSSSSVSRTTYRAHAPDLAYNPLQPHEMD